MRTTRQKTRRAALRAMGDEELARRVRVLDATARQCQSELHAARAEIKARGRRARRENQIHKFTESTTHGASVDGRHE